MCHNNYYQSLQTYTNVISFNGGYCCDIFGESDGIRIRILEYEEGARDKIRKKPQWI
jgi:hypothetical protein